tara:strand:- start:753 stop:1427 length:675 start_codon:yes stop_codon:yes gene_type:complete
MDLTFKVILLLTLIIYIYFYQKYSKKKYLNIVPRYKNNIPELNTKYYNPQWIKKDTMNYNPIGTENLHIVEDDLTKPCRAWTTQDVSSTPSFYKSDFKTDLLGMKKFYDDENKFHSNLVKHDKPIYNPKMYPNKHCYINSDGIPECDFLNIRNETPYSLYNVNERGQSVNQPILSDSVQNVNGDEYLSLNYVKDKPMNGGGIFRNRNKKIVRGSNQVNEVPRLI